MVDTPETSRERDDLRLPGAATVMDDLKAWFVSEVLPLEQALMQFLQSNWRRAEDIADMRQDIYLRLFEAAKREIPRLHIHRSRRLRVARAWRVA